MEVAVKRSSSLRGPWWVGIIKLQDIIKLVAQTVPKANKTHLQISQLACPSAMLISLQGLLNLDVNPE